MHFVLRLFLTTLIPSLIPKVINKMFSTREIEQIKDNGGSLSAPRKTSDRTQFTKGMYDFATAAYERQIFIVATTGNKSLTNVTLTKYLNKVFGTHKAVVTMTRLFKGDFDRESMPTGIRYKAKEEK